LNLYVYAANNPIRYTDRSGHWFVDIFFTAIDIVQFVKHPSWENAAWLAADAASFLDPTGAASATAHGLKEIKLASNAVKVVYKLDKGPGLLNPVLPNAHEA
jgi:hypothetical protein